MLEQQLSNNVPALSFSDKAVRRVQALIAKQNTPKLKLRVYVTGGGCSGFSYGFTLDEAQEEGDTEVVKEGVSLVVDPLSIQYLNGAGVDYVEDLQGARFIISNPNAKTTCGCGASFAV